MTKGLAVERKASTCYEQAANETAFATARLLVLAMNKNTHQILQNAYICPGDA
jgi:hypothetical protein